MIHSHSRRFICHCVATLVLWVFLFGGAAQAEPGAVKLLVGFPPGGGTDTIARILADKLKGPLGSIVIVENRAGAGGRTAAEALKAAPADGGTFFLSHDHTVSILPLVMKNPGFDPARDFVAVAGFATFVNALALSGGTPAKSMGDYAAWVRSRGPGPEKVGVPAPASVPEFLVRLIDKKFAVNLQAFPYQGSAPMMAEMLNNRIAAGVASLPDLIENHKAGKIRIIAVLGGKRQAALPDVPTFAELGLAGFEELPYYGFFAPGGTPGAIIARFSDALAQVVALPDVRDRLTALGLTVGHMTSRELADREKAYARTWAHIIRESGFEAR